MSSKLIGAGAVLLLAAGCNTVDPRTGSVDRSFGEAVAWNKATQTVNPDPIYTADTTPPGSDGAKAVGASERYRTDKVKPIEAITSTQAGSSGSGPQ